MTFDFQPSLFDGALTLAPMIEADFDGLYAAAKDPEVWALHQVPTRYKRAEFRPYITGMIATKRALTLRGEAGRIIGCSAYYQAEDAPDGIAVGYTFLALDTWGGATNFALKRMMLDHAFQSFDEVGFHIAPGNIRSQKATAKLGAKRIGSAILNLGGTPADWVQFRLSRADWQAVKSARN
ncbi:MAG: RimJ/RimL family protein N-acetyltransferase [Halocynthiibacter sp.]|jgi:RimJ/RimL family protein N-acetyltransferase